MVTCLIRFTMCLPQAEAHKYQLIKSNHLCWATESHALSLSACCKLELSNTSACSACARPFQHSTPYFELDIVIDHKFHLNLPCLKFFLGRTLILTTHTNNPCLNYYSYHGNTIKFLIKNVPVCTMTITYQCVPC